MNSSDTRTPYSNLYGLIVIGVTVAPPLTFAAFSPTFPIADILQNPHA